ncbi:hypothetical protein [Streptacidiphilus cavernicola]|uniref:Uncharacterized protein n=1 Tax=Streptacidiphilus cavernicola TaxID=3342716 RepID=A0ABV6VSS4_9ACTN
MKTRTAASAVMLAPATAVGTAGCSRTAAPAARPATPAGRSAAAAVPPPTGAPTAGLTKGMVLPLEAYMENRQQMLVIDNGRLAVEAKCLARYGFSISTRVTNPGNLAPGFDEANMERRYGVSDLDEAMTYGYHLAYTPTPVDSASNTPDSPSRHALVFGATVDAAGVTTPLTTYDGKPVPQGGCLGEATRQIGDGPLQADLPHQLDLQSMNLSTAEPQVQAVIARWSRCMRSAGYRAVSPEQTGSLYPVSKDGLTSTAEIKAAVADVRCKQSTGLVATWFAAETAVQRQLIDRNQSALDQEKTVLSTAVKRAAALAG